MNISHLYRIESISKLIWINNGKSNYRINKELKEVYGFKKLNNFKPALLEVIYKIIVGDKIKFTFE